MEICVTPNTQSSTSHVMGSDRRTSIEDYEKITKEICNSKVNY